MSLNVHKFRSQLRGGGAKSNYFKVILNFPTIVGGPTEQASFLIKASSFPASVVGKIEVPFRGRQVPYPGDRTFDDWQVTVINANDFAIRDALLRWSNLMNDMENNTGIQDPEVLIADMLVQQLDKNENVIKSIKIHDAFPLNVGEIEVSYDSTDTIQEYTVDFAYLLWKPEGSSSIRDKIVSGARSLLRN